MKTSDEIKRGLKACYSSAECTDCPYIDEDLAGVDCCDLVKVHAKALIQQLEQDNAQKDERIRQLEREREAAIKDMHAAQGCVCLVCKNFIPEESGDKKYACKGFGGCEHEEDLILCTLFEWRGVEEEEA